MVQRICPEHGTPDKCRKAAADTIQHDPAAIWQQRCYEARDALMEARAALRWIASNADVPADFPSLAVRLRQIASRAQEALDDTSEVTR
jgi:hypothetical protein